VSGTGQVFVPKTSRATLEERDKIEAEYEVRERERERDERDKIEAE
jgi:hypothetical protein